MGQWGMLVDLRRCIGCQACTVACKAENDVPLGVFRRRVRTLMTGSYPDVGRHFVPISCFHCEHPKCLPACVQTCEGGAFQFGDLKDPSSAIAKAIAANDTKVLKPRKKMNPSFYYIGLDDAVQKTVEGMIKGKQLRPTDVEYDRQGAEGGPERVLGLCNARRHHRLRGGRAAHEDRRQPRASAHQRQTLRQARSLSRRPIRRQCRRSWRLTSASSS